MGSNALTIFDSVKHLCTRVNEFMLMESETLLRNEKIAINFYSHINDFIVGIFIPFDHFFD